MHARAFKKNGTWIFFYVSVCTRARYGNLLKLPQSRYNRMCDVQFWRLPLGGLRSAASRRAGAYNSGGPLGPAPAARPAGAPANIPLLGEGYPPRVATLQPTLGPQVRQKEEWALFGQLIIYACIVPASITF
jgi:hypothetical protein